MTGHKNGEIGRRTLAQIGIVMPALVAGIHV
jgi:hypothetical protein